MKVIVNHVPTIQEVEEAMMDLSNNGFCVNCGSHSGPAEPDARFYTCESCGEKAVFGFEELLIMGRVSE